MRPVTCVAPNENATSPDDCRGTDNATSRPATTPRLPPKDRRRRSCVRAPIGQTLTTTEHAFNPPVLSHRQLTRTDDQVTFSENFVDIAGYLPRLATRRVTTHVVRLFGATSRPEEMEHAPVSLQRLVPFDVVIARDVRSVRDFRLTDFLITMNPGRADTVGDVAVACPSLVRADRVNVYTRPLVRPMIRQLVAVVSHVGPLSDVATV